MHPLKKAATMIGHALPVAQCHCPPLPHLSETNIIFIDNIFVIFDGRVFQQTVGILYEYKMSSSCRLVPLFVLGGLHKKKTKRS